MNACNTSWQRHLLLQLQQICCMHFKAQQIIACACCRLALARDAAFGMVYLHGRREQILHRDLKSPNLLLAQDLKVSGDCTRSKRPGSLMPGTHETAPKGCLPEGYSLLQQMLACCMLAFSAQLHVGLFCTVAMHRDSTWCWLMQLCTPSRARADSQCLCRCKVALLQRCRHIWSDHSILYLSTE